MRTILSVALMAVACRLDCSHANILTAGRAEAENSHVPQKDEAAAVIAWDSGMDFVGSDVEAWLKFKGIEIDDESPEVMTEENVEEANHQFNAAALDLQKHMAEIQQLLLQEAKRDSMEAAAYKEKKASLDAKRTALKKAMDDKHATAEGFERFSAWREKQELINVEKEKTASILLDRIAQAENVDLAFVIDGTHSMTPHINAVKDEIRKVVHNLRRTNISMKLRLAVVVYRDIADAQRNKRYEVLDFVESVETFESYIGLITPNGGCCDAPEDMATGIQKANQLSWSQRTRVVYIIADTPCHGRRFSGRIYDEYPQGTPGVDIVEELQSLQIQSGVSANIYFGKITEYTNNMTAAFLEEGIALKVVDVGTLR